MKRRSPPSHRGRGRRRAKPPGSCVALLASLFSLGLSLGPGAAAAQITYVDILIVYTPGAAALYGNSVETRIYHMLNVTNQMYEDSGVDIRLRPVHITEVNYTDSASSSTALGKIRTGSWPFQNISALRTQYGADMVALLRPSAGDGYCGLAYLAGPGQNGEIGIYAGWMFSHTTITCSDYVLGHELGVRDQPLR